MDCDRTNARVTKRIPRVCNTLCGMRTIINDTRTQAIGPRNKTKTRNTAKMNAITVILKVGSR